MANEPIVTIIGNLTADPELRYVGGDGTAVASFTVASTPRVKSQNGGWEDGEAMFVRCSVWREYAENATETLTKGMRVIVQGRLSARSFQRNDGTNGLSLDLQVDEVGPSLRYATATVSKNPPRQRPQTAATAPQTTPGRQPYQPAPNAPQSGHSGPENGTWGQPTLTDAPPF